jgi:hypothetical protein
MTVLEFSMRTLAELRGVAVDEVPKDEILYG